MKSYLKLVALFVVTSALVIQLHIFTTYGMGLDWVSAAIGAWLFLYAQITISMAVLVWRSIQVERHLKKSMEQNRNFYGKH